MKTDIDLNDWENKGARVTLQLSGVANYQLSKLRLSNPLLSKSKIAKSLLEKALEDMTIKS